MHCTKSRKMGKNIQCKQTFLKNKLYIKHFFSLVFSHSKDLSKDASKKTLFRHNSKLSDSTEMEPKIKIKS